MFALEADETIGAKSAKCSLRHGDSADSRHSTIGAHEKGMAFACPDGFAHRTSTIGDLQHFCMHVGLSSDSRGLLDAGLNSCLGRIDRVGRVQAIEEA